MYPTKKEILKERPEIPQKIIDVTLSWKKQFIKGWKNQPLEYRMANLEVLIWMLAITQSAITNQKRLTLQVERRHSYEYAYDPKRKIIYLDKEHPSIISTLHELAHYFYGSDELIVCRWSVHLFKECFPGLYKNLKWKGHLLCKKITN